MLTEWEKELLTENGKLHEEIRALEKKILTMSHVMYSEDARMEDLMIENNQLSIKNRQYKEILETIANSKKELEASFTDRVSYVRNRSYLHHDEIIELAKKGLVDIE